MRTAWQTTLGLLVAIVWTAPALAQDEIDVEKLRPGLIATFRDTKSAVEIVRVEPAIALMLKGGETVHPRLAAHGGTARWDGYINILRPGTYRFSANLWGKFRLQIQGKDVLAGRVHVSTVTGVEVKLEAGIFPVAAEFTRTDDAARIELFWQLANARREPLGHELFFHLPAKAHAQLKTHQLHERGRLLAEEHACASCHQPRDADQLARGLLSRRGPDLSQVGGRVHADWIEEWLEAPHKVRPGAVMPQLFADDAEGRRERQAVAHYLATLGGPIKSGGKPPNAKELTNSLARGQRLFHSVGCIACHSLDKPKDSQLVVLSGLARKTTPEKLAEFLHNPLATNPTGRMPHMLLTLDEARDIARFLHQREEAKSGNPKRVAENQAELGALGKQLVVSKGCANCHTIAPNNMPIAPVAVGVSFDDLKNPKTHDAGCLASTSAKVPRFALPAADRLALRAFLRDGTSGSGSPSPVHEAQATLTRFNCLACHNRNGEGGLSPESVEELRRYEKAENAEAVTPPPLTGVGHKLRTPWLKQVLLQAGRARPWMGLRMPQFGEANVGKLPESLAALDGTVPDDTVHKVALTPAKVDAGRHLVGKNAMGCISCHDIAGIANAGTRGPDLALMNQRVRYEWYRRWLEQAQRMQPGTRMPTVFPDGKSLLPAVLGGDAEQQAEAMWAYLALGMNLPLPEGLEPPKGLILSVKDRPVLLRTFLPDAGTRAIAVGYPRGVSVAFDAATCRLAYAWSGNFLDASPAWNNRGGAPAKVLGPRFWTAPPGNPWARSDGLDPPDFAGRARDPAFGGPLPDGKLLETPSQIAFEGYSTDPGGVPTFHYRVGTRESAPFQVQVSERVEPLQSGGGIGIARHFRVVATGGQWTWLLVAESTKEPRGLSADGTPEQIEGFQKVNVAPECRLLVPQGDGRAVLLKLADSPPDGIWHVRRGGPGWQVFLGTPGRRGLSSFSMRLNMWLPYRDDPALLKELLAK